MIVLRILAALALCSSGICYTCPPESATAVRDVFGSSRFAQRGLWFQIACPEYRRSEAIDGIFWWKDSKDPEHGVLNYFLGRLYNFTDRHEFGEDLNLVIRGVLRSDEGQYLCNIDPKLTISRDARTSLQVIDDTLPASPSTTSSSITLKRGQRHRLQCQCSSQATAVVYWSMGEGATSPTDIVAARFPDQSVFIFKDGAVYSIDSTFSLILNSLNAVPNPTRFWCHVFLRDGSQTSCYTDVQISDASEPEQRWKASKTSFYLEEGKKQSLPCIGWTSGDQTCHVKWSKATQELLQYQVSSDESDGDSSYTISADFSLVIKSVRAEHAGSYRCSTSDAAGDLEVRVIGDHFPIDGGSATVGQPVTFAPDRIYTIKCPDAVKLTSTTESILFWSFGSPSANTTTIIGRRTALAMYTTMKGDVDDCFTITTEGSLVMKNCSHETAVRYWCHVFPEGGLLQRSYVDVIIPMEPRPPSDSSSAVIAIVIIVSVLILALIIACVVWKRRLGTYPCRWSFMGHGEYKEVDRKGLVDTPELDADWFKIKLKRSLSPLGGIPFTPWASYQRGCRATVDAIYVQPEMHLLVWPMDGENPVRYKLQSERELFKDGIQELSSTRVLIIGRSGSGKTTFLRKLVFDWAMGRENALLGGHKLLFYLTMGKLMKADNVGRAVVQESLYKCADVSAASINRYCAANPTSVAICIDDCNSPGCIDSALTTLRRQGLSDCTVVMATRDADLADDPASRVDMRHVTLGGLSRENSLVFIEKIISEHIRRLSDSSSHETDKCVEITQLQNYVKRDVLPIEIFRRPSILVSLCQLSIWTKGRIFKSKPTMGDVFLTLIKCLFDLADNREWSEESELSDEHLQLLVKLGKVTLEKMDLTSGGPVSLDRADCCKLTDDQLTLLNKVGVIRYEKQVLNDVGEDEEDVDEDDEDDLRTETRGSWSFPCLCLRRESGRREEDVALRDVEAPGQNDESPKQTRIEFVLEILQESCAGAYLSVAPQSVKDWLVKFTGDKVGTENFINSYATVLAFASRNDKVVPTILDFCRHLQKEAERKHLKDWNLHQRLVELLLHLGYEGKWEVPLEKMVPRFWRGGKIRLLGVSKRRIRLLCSLLNRSKESKSRLTSLRLLRIGRDDWAEIQQCIRYVGFDLQGDKYLASGPTTCAYVEDGQTDQTSDPATIQTVDEISPETPESTPGTPDYPGIQSTQGTSDTPVNPATQGTPGTPVNPVNPATQGTSDTPDTPASQGTPDTPDFQVTPDTPDSQGTPGTPDAPGTPFTPGIQGTPGSPDSQSTPCTPAIQGTAGTPDSQGIQGTPEAPDSQRTQCIQDAQGSSDTPVTSEQPDPSPASPEPSAETSPETRPPEESFEVVDLKYSSETLKQVRRRVEDSETDVPEFASSLSDSCVLLALQSNDLQSLVGTQCGPCHSSVKESVFAQCILGLTNLEELVLIGTILGSNEVCHVATNINKLPHLRKLDLRLNKEFNDFAFVAIIKSLHACKKLTDLRLSLYKVTMEGFDEARKEIAIDKGTSLVNLEALHLLHGSTAEVFLGFLTGLLPYLHLLRSFHISCVTALEIRDEAVTSFENEMRKSDIMPNLKDLVITKMETVRSRLSTLELPKKKSDGELMKKIKNVKAKIHLPKLKAKGDDTTKMTGGTKVKGLDTTTPTDDSKSHIGDNRYEGLGDTLVAKQYPGYIVK